MNVSQIIRYVVGHPKVQQCFPGWSYDQIALYVLNGVKDDEVFIATNNEEIKGLLRATVNHSERLIKVDAILASDATAFRTFVGAWKLKHPDYKIVGSRDKRRVQYELRNFNRFIKPSGHIIPTFAERS